METASGRAPHLVERDRSQVAGAVAGLLEKLAARSVLETLVPLHVPAGQQPGAREGTGALFHDQDPSGVIKARDDGARAGAVGHLG